jgi:hypothetical protein
MRQEVRRMVLFDPKSSGAIFRVSQYVVIHDEELEYR